MSSARPGQPSVSTTLGPLRRRLADLAPRSQRGRDPQEVLDRVVGAAVALVPGARAATVSRVRERSRVTSVATTGPGASAFDVWQQDVAQGPCLDALFEQRTVRVEHLGTETRWPVLARRAAEVGVQSALCFQLYVDGDDLGALTLLSPDPGAFHDEAEDVGGLLAACAAIAVAHAEDLANVRAALESRDVIGQAKGILMARDRLTADQAFAVLARSSQNRNRKLRDVAEEVAATGHLER